MIDSTMCESPGEEDQKENKYEELKLLDSAAVSSPRGVSCAEPGNIEFATGVGQPPTRGSLPESHGAQQSPLLR